MSQENTKLCDFSNTNNNDFISTPITPATSAESYEINAALLNLVMEDHFSGLPSEDAASHLESALYGLEGGESVIFTNSSLRNFKVRKFLSHERLAAE